MTDENARPRRPVVVGVDGSEDSLAAADLAADEAAVRQLPLEIVHGLVLPVASRPATVPPDLPPLAPAPELDDTPVREHAAQLLSGAAARVKARHPELPVITRLRDGFPTWVLTDASRQASLVVVGHRGSGGFTELLAGSVGIQLANHAACPVIVVRGRPAPGAPVVVGVDGSEGSRRAAEFALAAADWHEVPLVALYAWPLEAAWPPALAQAGYPPPQAPDPVAEAMSGLTERFPQVPVHPEVRRHLPAHEALVAASKDARLVVVGSRGRGGFRGLLLGSVSQALIHHARCPVAVVGPEAEPATSVSPEAEPRLDG
jgi:nucleotide-binding universal stress UspA family protein